MKEIFRSIKGFFLPPEGTPLWLRLAPYIALGILSIFALWGGAYAWEYTNSPEFCGQACHTMPPEYTSYLESPHARIDCVDCHIGDGFITTRITRKAGDLKHVIATVFQTYEYPIKVKSMRPARETCELCHFPEKFSDDSLRENVHFRDDLENSSYKVYLLLKTGGGSGRLGLGQGIHWHIENPVYYLPIDKEEQEIPYVRVVNDDGSITEYLDIESDLDLTGIVEEDLTQMDCITCHNRITHLVSYPDETIDKLIGRGLISPEIPEIRKVALETYYKEYTSVATALAAFDLLDYYYREKFPAYYEDHQDKINLAISELKTSYQNSVFPEQKVSWSSHKDNIGHENSPGCLRCHDGQHLNQEKQAIRLECNLCHAIPVVAEAGDFMTQIEISSGPEPENHLDANWISYHHLVFDTSCTSCHTTADPGGSSNTSFCSNSACHGISWEYAGFDAPALRETILELLPPPNPAPPPAEMPADPENLTYSLVVGDILVNRCGICHGASGQAGLDFTTYASLMAGNENGPVISAGDPDTSRILVKTVGDSSHFAQFNTTELELIRAWIISGAR